MGNEELNIFEKFLYEAPNEDPPDEPADRSSTGPPDIPEDTQEDSGPPDIGGIDNDESGDDITDEPPDLSDENFGDDGDFGDSGEDLGNPEENDNPNETLGLDEKISAIMNMNLYQKYLSLLNSISSQITMIKNNTDVLYAISPESLDIIKSLKKLEENIHLYINNSFINENYSKNLLFFNKCLNLLRLLNDVFDKNIRKGIKAIE